MSWRRRFPPRLLTSLLGSCLGLAIITTLSPGATFHDGSHGTALDDPTKSHTHESNLNRKPVSIENGSTGNIMVQLWPRKSLQRTSTNTSKHELDIYHRQFQCLPGTDCDALQQELSEWPSDKPRAVIYLLSQASRMIQLRKLLQSLDTHFNNQFRYPVVIFHESDVTASLRATIRNFSHSRVYFHEISFAVLPAYIRLPVPSIIPCRSHVSYRHMCRFQAKTVYELSILQGVDYVWRLDDDSTLTSAINYDLFLYMRAHNLTYGYHSVSRDNHNCIKGLWNATSVFMHVHNLETKSFDQWKEPEIYYNNFEISALSLWTNGLYSDYVDYLDHLGGIFEHRWGDAPIKTLAVCMFAAKRNIHKFSDIGYTHAM